MLGFLRGDDFKLSTIAPVDGSHKGISKDNVFKRSADNAITPDNPPETIFDTYRTMPVCDRVREFTPEEADGLSELARVKKQNAKATKKAADQHESILNSEAKINRHGQRMIRNEAEFEVKTQGYKGTTAKSLHGMRPRYAAMGKGLEKSEQLADQAINNLMAQL
ncbi:conserved hypothetical protein [Planktothrix sp. PCC 11201]|uniref:hypothetical protein n=1 Tax=Planktothrix sp. PCC 11201 TaxID=1729650 RepID=UPI0009147D55|nr:hypothetical protein [Planktothrix sp. PCC 11201]SKB14039.1 conserved hypothetical protein [Planktothrix sp. PCC 11201]